MKKRIRIGIVAVVCILFLTVICVYSVPKLRVSLFVVAYHELIEEVLETSHSVPADDAVFLGYKAVNNWDSVHAMTEFVIMSWGGTYYGCYYSPDDVPLAFQNTEVELVQSGSDSWEWRSEGDNHGTTSKLMECWYFFKASF